MDYAGTPKEEGPAGCSHCAAVYTENFSGSDSRMEKVNLACFVENCRWLERPFVIRSLVLDGAARSWAVGCCKVPPNAMALASSWGTTDCPDRRLTLRVPSEREVGQSMIQGTC